MVNERVDGHGGVEVVRLAVRVVDASVHTFEMPGDWHRPECLRHPRVQPSHFRNWDRRHNGDG